MQNSVSLAHWSVKTAQNSIITRFWHYGCRYRKHSLEHSYIQSIANFHFLLLIFIEISIVTWIDTADALSNFEDALFDICNDFKSFIWTTTTWAASIQILESNCFHFFNLSRMSKMGIVSSFHRQLVYGLTTRCKHLTVAYTKDEEKSKIQFYDKLCVYHELICCCCHNSSWKLMWSK